MKPAVTQPRRRGARPGFPMRHKLAQLPFEAMEPMGMEVTGVVRHGLSRGSGEHRGRANQSSDIDGQTREGESAGQHLSQFHDEWSRLGRGDIDGQAREVAGEDDGHQIRQTLPQESAKTAHFGNG